VIDQKTKEGCLFLSLYSIWFQGEYHPTFASRVTNKISGIFIDALFISTNKKSESKTKASCIFLHKILEVFLVFLSITFKQMLCDLEFD